MSGKKRSNVESSTDRLPSRPTKETAVDSAPSERALAQRAEPAGVDSPDHLGHDRVEVPGSVTPRSRPHVPAQEADDESQSGLSGHEDAPVLPANASGFDKLTPEVQDEEIDEESMYDRRPERDKDRPPSKRLEE